MPLTALICLLLLCLKHFIADGILQNNWMALNKGNINHPAGVVHAGIHVLFTVLVLIHFNVQWDVLYTTIWGEWIIHYGIDWAKVNFTKPFNLSHFDPEKGLVITDSKYFWWLVLDQCIHFATYCLLVYWVI